MFCFAFPLKYLIKLWDLFLQDAIGNKTKSSESKFDRVMEKKNPG